jgi:F-box/leucine-rich repeat protein 2/20
LKELHLEGNSQLTDAALTGLSEGCWPEMETLDLQRLPLLSDTSFSSLARACPSLVVLWLRETKVTDEAVWTLCQLCPSILKLDINSCPNVTDRSLVAISEHLPSLTALDCAENEAITDDGIEKLVAKCHFIQCIGIRCPSITDRSIQSIADHCPALETLDVSWNEQVTAVSLEALGHKCRKLIRVSMSGLKVEDKESLEDRFPSIFEY